jgi:polyisoprenoid-binding protein YceI
MRAIGLSGRALAILALAAAPALADSYAVDNAHSEVTFRIRHLVSSVSGRFTEFAGNVDVEPAAHEKASVSFTIQTASIDTANERRDGHLRSEDFFNAEAHPEITFESSSVLPKGDGLYHVTGTLTMRGVSKEVTLPVRYLGSIKDQRGNEKAGFEIETTLDRKDYGIVWNTALDEGGFVLGDEVQIRIALQATKQAAESAGGAR